jgi:hypothetical protein
LSVLLEGTESKEDLIFGAKLPMSGEMPDIYMGREWPADNLETDPTAPPNLLRTGTPDLSSMNYAFHSGSLSFGLSAEKQTSLMESIEAVFQSDGEDPLNEDQEMPDAEDEEPEVDLEDRQVRTDKLKGVLPTIAQLWWCQSERMEQATERLADGSRNRRSMPFLLHVPTLFDNFYNRSNLASRIYALSFLEVFYVEN